MKPTICAYVLLPLALLLAGCSSNSSVVQSEEKIVTQPRAPLVEHLIFFDWDKDIPPENVQDIIRPHVRYLVQNPNQKLLIEGAADETGSYDYNLKLGMRRANVIRNHFIAMGISPSQLIVRTIGIERKLNLEEKPYSLPRNRRVTLIY